MNEISLDFETVYFKASLNESEIGFMKELRLPTKNIGKNFGHMAPRSTALTLTFPRLARARLCQRMFRPETERRLAARCYARLLAYILELLYVAVV